jgi:hypothetical protein
MADSAKSQDRRHWPVRRYTLAAQPPEDLSDETTAEERLAMMWPLALDSWTLAGLPFPDYPRGAAPVRLVAAMAVPRVAEP